jgi:hypothetical protein
LKGKFQARRRKKAPPAAVKPRKALCAVHARTGSLKFANLYPLFTGAISF